MKLTYTTAELAEELHCDRHKIDSLRRAGILQGIRKGKTYIFWEREVTQALKTLTELQADISNDEAIAETAERIRELEWQQQRPL